MTLTKNAVEHTTTFMKHFAGTPEERKKHKDMIEEKFNIVKDIQNSIPKFPEMLCLA